MRVSSSLAVRSNAGSVSSSLPGSRPGSGMLQWIRSGPPRDRGADLAQPVAEGDHMIEAPAHELTCLERRPERSIPRRRITRTALGCSGLGRLPALAASTAPPDLCTASASAICERALLPVHRNSTRTAVERGSRRVDHVLPTALAGSALALVLAMLGITLVRTRQVPRPGRSH